MLVWSKANLALKSVIFLLIGVILFTLLNHTYINTWDFRKSRDYKSNPDSPEKFKFIPYGLEIGSFGTSHALHGFDFTGMKGFNFALSAQHNYYDDKLLKQYSNHFSKEAVIVIEVAYFSFEYDLDKLDEKYTRRYSTVFKDTKPTFRDYLFERYPLIGSKSKFESVILEKLYPPQIDFYSALSDFDKDVPFTDNGLETAARHREQRMNPAKLEQDMTLYIDMIQYAKNQNLKPVIITSPFYKTYNEGFGEQGLKRYYDHMKYLREHTGDTPYFDYSHDARFTADAALFMDGDHLNYTGRKLFTKIVVEDLRKAGILKYDLK